MSKPNRQLFLALALTLGVAACGKGEPPKPPEKLTYITASGVAQQDLAVTESAVGAETALGIALDYDPTRIPGKTFYVRLPFPEHVASRLKIGQTVTLTGFADEGRSAQGRIREIRPALNASTLSREVIVAVNDHRWRPSGSVRGEVVLGVHQGALVVPEQAVVLRPAGNRAGMPHPDVPMPRAPEAPERPAGGGTPGTSAVVYVIEAEVARERVVKTGIARAGMVEIVQGLSGGETVAVDGAGLLTDGARIKLREPGP